MWLAATSLGLRYWKVKIASNIKGSPAINSFTFGTRSSLRWEILLIGLIWTWSISFSNWFQDRNQSKTVPSNLFIFSLGSFSLTFLSNFTISSLLNSKPVFSSPSSFLLSSPFLPFFSWTFLLLPNLLSVLLLLPLCDSQKKVPPSIFQQTYKVLLIVLPVTHPIANIYSFIFLITNNHYFLSFII